MTSNRLPPDSIAPEKPDRLMESAGEVVIAILNYQCFLTKMQGQATTPKAAFLVSTILVRQRVLSLLYPYAWFLARTCNTAKTDYKPLTDTLFFKGDIGEA
jgi:hypothetical protein